MAENFAEKYSQYAKMNAEVESMSGQPDSPKSDPSEQSPEHSPKATPKVSSRAKPEHALKVGDIKEQNLNESEDPVDGNKSDSDNVEPEKVGDVKSETESGDEKAASEGAEQPKDPIDDAPGTKQGDLKVAENNNRPRAETKQPIGQAVAIIQNILSSSLRATQKKDAEKRMRDKYDTQVSLVSAFFGGPSSNALVESFPERYDIHTCCVFVLRY